MVKRKKISLEADTKYTDYEDTKALIIKKYSSEDNKLFFKNSITCLATVKKNKINIIFEFKDKNGVPCDFWTFCDQKIKDKSHTIIYIYAQQRFDPNL